MIWYEVKLVMKASGVSTFYMAFSSYPTLSNACTKAYSLYWRILLITFRRRVKVLSLILHNRISFKCNMSTFQKLTTSNSNQYTSQWTEDKIEILSFPVTVVLNVCWKRIDVESMFLEMCTLVMSILVILFLYNFDNYKDICCTKCNRF